jgi:hypothetical protein
VLVVGFGSVGFVPDTFEIAVFFFGFTGQEAGADGTAAVLGGIQRRI